MPPESTAHSLNTISLNPECIRQDAEKSEVVTRLVTFTIIEITEVFIELNYYKRQSVIIPMNK